MSWSRGSVVVHRDRWWSKTWRACAAIVVEDSPTAQVTYMPPGSEVAAAGGADAIAQLTGREWELEGGRRHNHTLAIHRPGDSFSVRLICDEDWRPLCWYINLEAPHRRTAIGFDTQDHQLDVVLPPDRSGWEWKDDDHLEAAQAAGLCSAVEVGAIRRAGERAVALVQVGRAPFGDEWLAWRPDDGWSTPELPEGWDDTPPGRLGMVVPPWEPCPMCSNVAGIASPTSGLPAVVAEDELTFAFVAPVAHGGMDGHALVIPRRHVETILDLTAAEEAALAHTVGRVARAVDAALDHDGILVVQRNGLGADQSVPHVHHHVIPRNADVPYPPQEWLPRTPPERRHEVAELLRAHLVGVELELGGGGAPLGPGSGGAAASR